MPYKEPHYQHEYPAYCTDCAEGCSEGISFAHLGFIGKVEVGGFHAKGEQHQQESGVGVDIGYYAIAATFCRNLISVERHEQIVQEATHYAAQPVDDRIRQQFL